MLISGGGEGGIVLVPLAEDDPLEFTAGDGGGSFDRFEEQPSPSVEVGDCSTAELLCATLEIHKLKLVLEASERLPAQ